jgi:predicted secreted protein
MATASICGLGGSVTGTGATEIYKWEITVNKDAIEATSFDSQGWKEKVACLIGASGTFSSRNSASTVGLHAGVAFKTSASGVAITGNIIISKISVSTPVDGIINYDHTFVFTGLPVCSALI